MPPKLPMTTAEFLRRIEAALSVPDGTIPGDLDAIADLICPALAVYIRTENSLIADCKALGIPTTDADGPLPLYRMTEAIVKQRRLVSDVAAAADLAEIRSRLTTAGYVPATGETTGDLVARALRDTREAHDRRDEAEREIESLREQLRDARTLAGDLAAQLNHAAGLIARMSATLSRLTN